MRSPEFVDRLRAGDEAAWRDLWEIEGRTVLRFGQSRLGDADQAEELRQEVFLEVWRSIDRFEGRSTLSTWMLGIANHLAYKRRGRVAAAAARLAPIEHAGFVAIRPDPERAFDLARLLGRCAELVGREISPWPRAVFEQHVLLGRPLRAVANALGRSTEAAKVSLFRTRQRLRAGLRDVADVLDPAGAAVPPAAGRELEREVIGRVA